MHCVREVQPLFGQRYRRGNLETPFLGHAWQPKKTGQRRENFTLFESVQTTQHPSGFQDYRLGEPDLFALEQKPRLGMLRRIIPRQ